MISNIWQYYIERVQPADKFLGKISKVDLSSSVTEHFIFSQLGRLNGSIDKTLYWRSKEGLNSGITEKFILSQCAAIKGGKILLDAGKT